MTTTTLETGWGPDTDPADSLARRFLLHWADECTALAEAAGGHSVLTAGYALADAGRPSAFGNAAVLLAPPADWDATLDEIEADLESGRGRAHLWSLWPTPDLAARGWELDGHPPLLARPPVSLQPITEPGEPPRRLTDPTDLAAWEECAIDAFPLDELRGEPTGAVAGPALLTDPRVTFWATEESGRIATASMQFASRGLNGLAFAATRPQARRRGHWWRHAAYRLALRPDLWSVGVFSDDSRPGAQSIGFVPILRLTLWHRDRP
jgi:hypothetical protein